MVFAILIVLLADGYQKILLVPTGLCNIDTIFLNSTPDKKLQKPIAFDVNVSSNDCESISPAGVQMG